MRRAGGDAAAPGLAGVSRAMPEAIDETAFRDAWTRYGRGERKTFSPALYTDRGRGTFEEIRRRYQSDRGFRDEVNRFVDAFEHEMAELSRADESGRRSRSHLYSDNGKLYTLLAHASGRLD
jgi:hypothetical protein